MRRNKPIDVKKSMKDMNQPAAKRVFLTHSGEIDHDWASKPFNDNSIKKPRADQIPSHSLSNNVQSMS